MANRDQCSRSPTTACTRPLRPRSLVNAPVLTTSWACGCASYPNARSGTWGERAGELILLAMDESGWLSLVGVANRGFLAGADRGRPRVDWRDLETYSEGV